MGMPKRTATIEEVTQKKLDEIIKWAKKLGAHYAYNASKGGYQINGVVYRTPSFSFDDRNEDAAFFEEHPNACRNCREMYAVGGCPACGE
jgi:MoaA/NifB/PqqE/SkfB family radical SAM enzyme